MTGDFGVCKFRRLLFVSCAGLATTNLIDLTDVIIAGNVLGETALTVTNLFWPCIDFEFFVCTAVAAGTAILHSRAVGEFNARRASDLFSNGLILSALTGLSRWHVGELFSKERVTVNGRIVTKESTGLKCGDVFSARGFGKYIYDGISGKSKKERLYVTVRKYS